MQPMESSPFYTGDNPEVKKMESRDRRKKRRRKRRRRKKTRTTRKKRRKCGKRLIKKKSQERIIRLGKRNTVMKVRY